MESTPQLEDGYTRIANELVEAMARGCPGFTEGQIIFCILRKTYGWNKKSDKISISQLVEMTGKSRRMIIYALQNLEAKKMITVIRSFQHINEITLNKNHSEWKPEAKSNQYQKLHPVQHIAPSATFSTSLVQHSVNNIPKVAPTKDTIQKTITKDTSTKVEEKTGKEIVSSGLYGNLEVTYIVNKLQKHLGMTLDGSIKINRRYSYLLLKKYSKEQVEALFKALPLSSFWSGKVTSVKDLYYNAAKIINSLGDQKGGYIDLTL